MKIAFIQTGGTIDKDYPHHLKGWAFEIGEPAFKQILENAQQQHEVSYHKVLKKDSLEITEKDRQNLKDYITQLPENKIIITHGSDTLKETAQVLSDVQNKTILITAAMLPEKFKNSDAPFSLGMAVGGAQILKPGVYLVIQGYIAEWNQFERNMESGKYHLK